MPPVSMPRSRSSGSDRIRHALCLLSRRGAVARLPSGAGDDARVQVRDDEGRERHLGAIARATWDRLEAEAWVAPAVGEAAWTITSRGIEHLKRRMSAGSSSSAEAPRRVEPAAGRPGYDPSECPVAWLSRRRDKDGEPLITPAQVSAAERLRADLYFAHMTPRVTTNWSAAAAGGGARRAAPGVGVELQDAVIGARKRVHRALAAVGPEFAGLLVDVCGHLKGLEIIERSQGWPQRSAKLLLRFALASLARHYGLERESALAGDGPVRVRHWGGNGYRPSLDGPREGARESSACAGSGE